MSSFRIVQKICFLVLILMAIFIVYGFSVEIHNENICIRNGYVKPVSYMKETYCFGKNGLPEIISIELLKEE